MRYVLPLTFAFAFKAMTMPCLAAEPASPLIDVAPFAETEEAKGRGDAADDAEVWHNKGAPEHSLILATDKKTGLLVLDLNGKLLQFLPVGRVNNVDLRDGWSVGKTRRVLIAVSDRTRRGISFFLLDPQSRVVTHLPDSFFLTDLSDPYGICFYRSRKTGALHVFVTGKDGQVRQVKVTPRAEGNADAELVRSFTLSSIAEGCVADDRTGRLYIAEEEKGIWRFDAEPEGEKGGTLIAPVDGTVLVPDIEGLTLAPDGETGGYLLASVQGNSTFAILSLPDEKLIARLRMVANPGKGVDAVTGTDGIAVATGDFGPGLPKGLLVVQDDQNEGGQAQNFKLVSWADILAALRQLGAR